MLILVRHPKTNIHPCQQAIPKGNSLVFQVYPAIQVFQLAGFVSGSRVDTTVHLEGP